MKNLKILIIEDDVVLAYALRESLEKVGYWTANIARNLYSALESVRTQPPDLALIDIHLGAAKEDGIAVAEALLEKHQMPIIYLTAYSDKTTVARAQQTHPAAYLLKPVRYDELAIQVELALANYQANQTESPDPYTAENIYLAIDQKKAYVKIVKNDVLFIEAFGMYMEVHLLGEAEKQLFSMPLGHIIPYFTSKNFYKLSRSLLVNLDHVERIENGLFYVKGRKESIKFAESQYNAFKNQFAIIHK